MNSTKQTSSTKTLAQNLAAYGASEAAAKLSRLFVVVAVAHRLDPVQIGLAAAALAAADILKALTENGVIQRIIAAPDSVLAATCAAAHRSESWHGHANRGGGRRCALRAHRCAVEQPSRVAEARAVLGGQGHRRC